MQMQLSAPCHGGSKLYSVECLGEAPKKYPQRLTHSPEMSRKVKGTQSRWVKRRTSEIGYNLGDSARPDWVRRDTSCLNSPYKGVEENPLERPRNHLTYLEGKPEEDNSMWGKHIEEKWTIQEDMQGVVDMVKVGLFES